MSTRIYLLVTQSRGNYVNNFIFDMKRLCRLVLEIGSFYNITVSDVTLFSLLKSFMSGELFSFINADVKEDWKRNAKQGLFYLFQITETIFMNPVEL